MRRELFDLDAINKSASSINPEKLLWLNQHYIKAMDPLHGLLEKTDRVEIKGPGTDLSFSIAGLPAVKCDGGRNIPDGEVYTAPVKDSVNGVIQYNTKTRQGGVVLDNIKFVCKDGPVFAWPEIRPLLGTRGY